MAKCLPPYGSVDVLPIQTAKCRSMTSAGQQPAPEPFRDRWWGSGAPLSRWVLCGAYEGYFASSLAVVGVFTCVEVKSTCRQAPFWLTQTREDR